MLSLEGKQLGNYDVIRRIRIGGMGAVYEGRQRTAFDRRVAIKVILGDYANDREMRRRFAREARTVARLHHPHILPLIEFGDEQGILYLVMPFIEGGTLTSYLRRSLPELGIVASIYGQLLDAVEYAHDAGLIHRDIKSSNVLLEMRRNAPPYVYLADFGLVRTSRQIDSEEVGKPIPLDKVPGTPHYMAPEQTRGIVTTSTDIYALGVLLYQMLTGQLPYNDSDDVRVIEMQLYSPIPSPSEHDASIPKELDEVVRVAMAKRPEDRFKNIAELRAAFQVAMKGPVPTTSSQEVEAVIEPAPLFPPRQAIATPLALPDAPRRHASVSLPAEELAVPLQQQVVRKPRPTTSIEVGEPAERQRITETVKNKPRITEEPVKPPRGRRPLPIIVAMAVPVLLLVLLLAPRLLGVALLPAGFPLLGASPVATIDVVAKSAVIRDQYLLTASPRVKAVDLRTHSIPDRVAQFSASDSRTVQTTGTKSLNGTQAQGVVLFINSGNVPITVPAQFSFATSGVHVQTTQVAEIPPHQNGQDGRVFVPAVVVEPGSAGNLPPNAINGSLGNGVSIQNPNPFSGGSDGQTVHVVNQSDIDGVQNALAAKLQQQALDGLRKGLKSNEVMIGQPSYKTTATPDSPVGTQVDQVRVTVTVVGSVSVYDRDLVNRTAIELLVRQAGQTLDQHYQLQGTPAVAPPRVVAPAKGDLTYLNVSVSARWIYQLSSQQVAQWLQSIKGASSAAASAYLSQQPGVASVQVHLPFGTDHLPTDVGQIRIVASNVAGSS